MDYKRLLPLNLAVLAAMAIIIGSFELMGCTAIRDRSDRENRIYTRDALSTLKKGHKAFQKGDFKMARQIFEPLSRHAAGSETKRKALYALACTRLVLAENPQEFKAAVDLWNSWSRSGPDKMQGEDPRMMQPLLFNLLPSVLSEEGTTHAPDIQGNNLYRMFFQVKEKEVQHLRDRLKQVEKENWTLKHQIDALEAIHQKIQEKKKEIRE